MSVFRKDRTSCQACAEVFPDLVEGRSGGPLHAQVKRRLAKVPLCARCYETYRRAVSLCRRTLRQSMPPAVNERLMAFLRARAGGRGSA